MGVFLSKYFRRREGFDLSWTNEVTTDDLDRAILRRMLEVQLSMAMDLVQKLSCRIVVVDFKGLFRRSDPKVRQETILVRGKPYRVLERVIDDNQINEDGLGIHVEVAFLSESIQGALARYSELEVSAKYEDFLQRYWNMRLPKVVISDKFAYIRRREVFCRADSMQEHEYELCPGRMVDVCTKCGFSVGSLA